MKFRVSVKNVPIEYSDLIIHESQIINRTDNLIFDVINEAITVHNINIDGNFYPNHDRYVTVNDVFKVERLED
jgi:hypothetical protein